MLYKDKKQSRRMMTKEGYIKIANFFSLRVEIVLLMCGRIEHILTLKSSSHNANLMDYDEQRI